MNHHLNLVATGWQQPTASPVLPAGEVHVWRVSLRVATDRLDYLNKVISLAERERFARFRFPADQMARTVAHGRMREIVGLYLDVPPESLVICTEELGKPFLRDYPDFHFNLSHAGDWALIACSRELEVGVDVEVIDPSFRVEDLVERYFSREEVPVILGLPETERHRAFFLAWTRKEAIIKARGDGLSLPLNQFGVTILAEDPVRVLHTDWVPGQELDWNLRAFTVAKEIPGAVAWIGEDRLVRFWEWGADAGAG